MPPRPRGLVFSDHVEDRMQKRGITRRDVREAIKNADTTYPGSRPKRGNNLVKEGVAPNGRRLCVVVKESRQHIIVSAWWKDDVQ